jgi:chitin disaccharide deacetylase
MTTTSAGPPAPRRSGAGKPLLIVNADDYGLTHGVSRAIIEAHHHGIVGSTSVLALGPSCAATLPWLRDAPRLGAGAHLAAVGEDPPLLSAREIPTLVDERGRLDLSWRQFLPRVATGRVDPEDLRREFGAQVQCLLDAGLVIDHLDTHQNIHLWPVVRRVLMELGELHGIRAVRITRSTEWGPVGVVVRNLARRLQHDCDHAGWAYPAATTGLDEAGGLDGPAMIHALFRLAATGAPTAELATHPGTADDPLRARYQWGYRWEDELAALCSPVVRAAVDEQGYRLGSYRDLAALAAG